jgi:hypothetical protein
LGVTGSFGVITDDIEHIYKHLGAVVGAPQAGALRFVVRERLLFMPWTR